MDKDLELRLIKDRFDPTNSRQIDYAETAQLLSKLYNSRPDNRVGAIVFDGLTEFHALSHGIFELWMNKLYLAVSGGHGQGGLRVYHLPDNRVSNEQNIIYDFPGQSKFSCSNSPLKKGWGGHLDLDLVAEAHTERGTEIPLPGVGKVNISIKPLIDVSVSIKIPPETKTLFFPAIDYEESRHLFWHNMAGRYGLSLETLENPSGVFYHAVDAKTGVRLTMKYESGAHEVKAEFPTNTDIHKLVESLGKVHLQKVDGEFCIDGKKPEKGKTVEVRVNDDNVMPYLNRVLGSAVA